MHRAIVLAGLAALVASSAAAQRTSTPDAIAQSAVDCWEATGASGIDTALLASRGWASSSIAAPGGKAVDTPLKFYAKSGTDVMLMVLPMGKSPGCSITARVGKIENYQAIVSQTHARLKSVEPGLKAARSKPNGVAFLGGGRIALLEPTGTKDVPAARIIVGYSAPEKK